nr:hypothetical protein BaRGS_014595 [Batillaria attramentaria]
MLAMLAASVLVGHCHSAETPAPGGTSQGGKAQSAPQPFDILDLVRVWPPAVCVKDGKPGCRIPSNIKSWIIHGLWPSNSNRRKPDPKDCQPSWKFSMQEIESLHGELKSEWPDESFTKRPKVAWRHEWEKHGTCATSLHPLRDEFHYFNATLALHRRFDLQKLLKPRDDPFTFDDILKTLKNGLGVIPQIT